MGDYITMILSATASIIAAIFAIYSFIEMKLDKKKQKSIVEGLEYRRIHGRFDVKQYIDSQKAVKKLLFLKQNNAGPEPETFNKKLTFTDYFGEESQLIINKGNC